MISFILKLFSSIVDSLRRAFQWFVYDATKGQRIAIGIGVIILIVVGIFSYQCSVIRENNRQKEIQRLEILKKQAELKGDLKGIEVIEEKIKVLDEKAEQQAEKTNKSIKTDSTEFNATDADNAFCKHYCWDSTCDDWRKVNGCKE